MKLNVKRVFGLPSKATRQPWAGVSMDRWFHPHNAYQAIAGIWALFSCTNFGYDGLAGTASYQVLQVWPALFAHVCSIRSRSPYPSSERPSENDLVMLMWFRQLGSSAGMLQVLLQSLLELLRLVLSPTGSDVRLRMDWATVSAWTLSKHPTRGVQSDKPISTRRIRLFCPVLRQRQPSRLPRWKIAHWYTSRRFPDFDSILYFGGRTFGTPWYYNSRDDDVVHDRTISCVRCPKGCQHNYWCSCIPDHVCRPMEFCRHCFALSSFLHRITVLLGFQRTIRPRTSKHH